MEVRALFNEDRTVTDMARSVATHEYSLLPICQVWCARVQSRPWSGCCAPLDPPAGNSVLMQRIIIKVIPSATAINIIALDSHHCLRHLTSFDGRGTDLAGFDLVEHLGTALLLSILIIVICRCNGSHAIVLGAKDGVCIADLFEV